MGNRLMQDEEREPMNEVQIQLDASSERAQAVWGDVMTRGKPDARQGGREQEAGEDERTGRQGWRVGDRVRVTSETKPFKGATGIIRAVEQEGWRLAPYYLYRVELAVGLVGYEYGELERLSPANT
jgi:hypothetical protein